MTLKKCLNILAKRALFLSERIKNASSELTYDKAELAALNMAITIIQKKEE